MIEIEGKGGKIRKLKGEEKREWEIEMEIFGMRSRDIEDMKKKRGVKEERKGEGSKVRWGWRRKDWEMCEGLRDNISGGRIGELCGRIKIEFMKSEWRKRIERWRRRRRRKIIEIKKKGDMEKGKENERRREDEKNWFWN